MASYGLGTVSGAQHVSLSTKIKVCALTGLSLHRGEAATNVFKKQA